METLNLSLDKKINNLICKLYVLIMSQMLFKLSSKRTKAIFIRRVRNNLSRENKNLVFYKPILLFYYGYTFYKCKMQIVKNNLICREIKIYIYYSSYRP